jgi:hypothetical protein
MIKTATRSIMNFMGLMASIMGLMVLQKIAGLIALLWALLLVPAGFAGALTVLALEIPVRTTADVLIPIVTLAPIYVGLFALNAWMKRQPNHRRYLGHTRGTWEFLVAVSYAMGAFGMLLF